MCALRFIAYRGVRNLLPIHPVHTLLFRSSGPSLEQVSLLLAIWSVTVVLLEIPSGLLSDRWSRKGMLVFASLLKMGCFLIWMLGSTFLFYALGFAEALASGAIETSLYDSLKLEENHTQFEQVYGRAQATTTLCVGLSC